MNSQDLSFPGVRRLLMRGFLEHVSFFVRSREAQRRRRYCFWHQGTSNDLVMSCCCCLQTSTPLVPATCLRESFSGQPQKQEAWAVCQCCLQMRPRQHECKLEKGTRAGSGAFGTAPYSRRRRTLSLQFLATELKMGEMSLTASFIAFSESCFESALQRRRVALESRAHLV